MRAALHVAAASVALVALALSFPASGDTVDDQLRRFELFDNCAPMDLYVFLGDSSAADIGVSKESIQTVAESRLRSARLYRTPAVSALTINVGGISNAFSIHVAYHKLVFDQVSGHTFRAATWTNAGIGSHTSDSSYILSKLSTTVDQFLVEFLRVNEEAC